MKLLLDENLSDRIVPEIRDLFPESSHMKTHGLLRTDDSLIWSFAKERGLTILSKDSDFHQRSLVYGRTTEVHFSASRQLLDGSNRGSFAVQCTDHRRFHQRSRSECARPCVN